MKYDELYHKMAVIIDCATGGRASKPEIDTDVITGLINDEQRRWGVALSIDAISDFVASGESAVCPVSGPVWSEETKKEVRSWLESTRKMMVDE